MPQEQIIIKFKPEGDDKLIKALKNLKKEQDKVANASKGANQDLKSYKGSTDNATIANNKLAKSQRLVEQRLTSNVKTSNILQGSFASLRNKLLLLSFSMTMAVKPMLNLIKAQSDAEETANKFNVVFGRQAGIVREWANNFGQSIGRASSELQGMLATLQDTFVPLGFVRKEASKLSISLTKLALDVASFNNKADADVIRDFQSALVGNHETVRKYGIVITEAQLASEALRSGIIETKRELTSQEKVQARLNLIVAGSKDAMGDLERTQDSYANTLKRFNAEVIVTQERLGKELIPIAIELLDIMTKLVIHFRDTDAIRNYALFLTGVGISMSGITTATFSLAGSLKFLRTAMIRSGMGALAVGLGYLAERFIFTKEASDEFGDRIDANAIKIKQASDKLIDLTQEIDNYEKAVRSAVDAESTQEAQMSDQIRTLQDLHKAENDILKIKQRLNIASINAIATDEDYIEKLKLGHKQAMEKRSAEQKLVIVKKQLTEASHEEEVGLLAQQKALEQTILHYSVLHPLEVQALANKQKLINAQKDMADLEANNQLILANQEKNALFDNQITIKEQLMANDEKWMQVQKKLTTAQNEMDVAGQAAAQKELNAVKKERISLQLQEIDEETRGMILKENRAVLEGRQTELQAEQNIINEKRNQLDKIHTGILHSETDAAVNRLSYKEAVLALDQQQIELDEKAIALKEQLIDMNIRSAEQVVASTNTAIGAVEANWRAIDNANKQEELSNARTQTQKDAIEEKYAKKAEDRAAKLQGWKLASAISNVALGITQTWRDPNLPVWGKAIATVAQAAAGYAQIQTIRGQEFEQGGLVGGRRHSQGGTMIEAEQGEFVMRRSAVQSIGIENLNRMNEGAGGVSNVTVNVSGNVMSQDYVEGELAGQIKEAIRRGNDFGVG